MEPSSEKDLSRVLKELFRVPKSRLEQLDEEREDFLQEIFQKLDENYHEEVFSTEFANSDLPARAKYVIGLSEFLDEEVSSDKSKLIHEHLSSCNSCRENYLFFLEVSKSLRYAFSKEGDQKYREQLEKIDSEVESPDNDLWDSLCRNLDLGEGSELFTHTEPVNKQQRA